MSKPYVEKYDKLTHHIEGYIIHYDIEPRYNILELESDPNRKPKGFNLGAWVDLRESVELPI